jgi:hypothetical protein
MSFYMVHGSALLRVTRHDAINWFASSAYSFT